MPACALEREDETPPKLKVWPYHEPNPAHDHRLRLNPDDLAVERGYGGGRHLGHGHRRHGRRSHALTYSVTDEYGIVQPSGSFTLGAKGQYSVVVSLQASRNGNDSNGRQYIIRIGAKDITGNAAWATVQVLVPHDQGK